MQLIEKTKTKVYQKCSSCLETKEIFNFHKKSTTKLGYQTICIKCSSSYHKQRRKLAIEFLKKNQKYLYDFINNDSNFKNKFWSKVEKKDLLNCWIWHGTIDLKGYGTISIKFHPDVATLNMRVHRISYMLFHNEIIDTKQELCVCHRCDNPKCVNPLHLFLGTNLENMQDKVKKNRQSKGEQTGVAILTDSRVKRIKKLLAKNRSSEAIKKIASFYKVSKATIYNIAKNKTWKHVKID